MSDSIDITEFGRFPAAPSPENMKPRPDRRAVASVLPHGSRMRVGELSAAGWRFEDEHEAIFPLGLVYSSSNRLAYVASRAGQQFVVVDGQDENERWDGISDELGWSPNGQSYLFVSQRGAEVFVAGPHGAWPIEGQPLPRRFTQNLDGSQAGWVTQDRHQQLFINGQKCWEAPQIIENPTWSPDGRRLAFAFASEKGVTVRVDGREFGPYPSLNKGTPVWSPDSRRCGWVIQRRGKSVVVVDGEEFGLTFSTVQGGTLSFSPDGSRWALAARAGLLGLKGCVVQDGQAGPVYLALGTTPPVWSPNGYALAYFAGRGIKHTFVVCDGREGQKCTAFIDGSLTWHHEGQVVGCIAQQDGLPCLALEELDGRSWSLKPPQGGLIRAEKVVFDQGRSLHDLGFRTDGSVFGWATHF